MTWRIIVCGALFFSVSLHAAEVQPLHPLPAAALRAVAADSPAAAALSHYLDAVDALEVGRSRNAMIAVERAIEAEPREPWYAWLQGVLHLLEQRPRDAEAALDRAEALFGQANQPIPVHVEAWRRAAAILQGRPDPKRIPDPEQPDSMEVHRLLATCRAIAETRGQRREGVGFDPLAIRGHEANWQIRSLALDVVSEIKNAKALSELVKRRAAARFKRGDALGALRSLDSIWENHKTDAELATARGIMMLWTGDAHGARGEFDRAIIIGKLDATPYLFRGFANARIGAVERAQLDLDRALQIAPEQMKSQQDKVTALQKEIAAARNNVPRDTPQKLVEQLERAAQSGEAFDQLVARARQVHLAHNNTVKRYDEYFGDHLYVHMRATAAQPNNPDVFVAAAQFIIDQVALGQPVQRPARGLSDYRWGAGEQRELEYANQILETALRLNPKHVGAIAARATIMMMSERVKEGCEWAERALEQDHVDPTLFWIVAVHCEREAIVAKYRAMGTNTHDLIYEGIFGRVYREIPMAMALVRDLNALNQKMQARADAALAAMRASGRPGLVHFLQAERARHVLATREAEEEYIKAIAADPDYLPARLRLAELYLRRAMFTDSPDKVVDYEARLTEHLSNAYNRIHATAFPVLFLAQLHIRQGALDQATPLLVRAAQLDPVDARVPMTQAWIESLRGQYRAAETKYQVALALEEARAGLSGQSLKADAQWIKNARRADQLTRSPDQKVYGRTAIARLCLAALLIEAGETDRARPYLRDNLAMLEALDDPDMEVTTAISPGRRLWATFGVTDDSRTRLRFDTVSSLTQRTRAALDAADWAASSRNAKGGRLAGQIYRRMMLEFQPYGNALEVRAMGQLSLAWAEQQTGRKADASRRMRAISDYLPPQVSDHLPIRDGQLSRDDLRAQQRMFDRRIRDASTDEERQRMAEESAKIARELSAAAEEEERNR